MQNINKALIIAAHPDDEVLGMGATIYKLSEMGKEIHLLIVTDGSTCQYRNSNQIDAIIASKKQETLNCAKLLGIKSVSYADLPDMKLDTIPQVDVNSVIENAINRIKPDTIFTHFYADLNMDHQIVYKSTMVATRSLPGQSVKNVLCYNVPSSTEMSPCLPNTAFLPNVYVDVVGKCAERKYEAIACYKSEIREFPHPRSIEYIKKQDIAEGLKVGVQCAEKFVLLKSIIG